MGQEQELPPLQLRAVGQVQILGEGIVLPAAGVLDASSAPHAGRAVEAHEPPAAIAGCVLDHEVPVQQDGLRLGQQRLVTVDMVPPSLNHSDFGVGEMVDGVLQNVAGRDEVRVEDAQKLSGGRLHALLERPGFVTFPVVAVQIDHVVPSCPHPLSGFRGDPDRLISRVIEHLNLKFLAGVIDLAGGLDDPAGNELLVVHRQLDGYAWQLLELRADLRRVAAVLVIQIDELVAMQPVDANDHQDRKINVNKDVAEIECFHEPVDEACRFRGACARQPCCCRRERGQTYEPTVWMLALGAPCCKGILPGVRDTAWLGLPAAQHLRGLSKPRSQPSFAGSGVAPARKAQR